MMDRTIDQPSFLLSLAATALKSTAKKYYRDGVEMEKGAIITERRIEKHRELYETICHYWSIYPDCFVDALTPTNSHFKLYFYQRIFLRVILRHGRVCVIAPRAFSKSFISILGMYLMCIFRPGIRVFICAPGKERTIAPCYREVA